MVCCLPVQVENEDLVFTLETMVEKFGDEIAPYAVSCRHTPEPPEPDQGDWCQTLLWVYQVMSLTFSALCTSVLADVFTACASMCLHPWRVVMTSWGEPLPRLNCED